MTTPEIRRIETTIHETGEKAADRTDVTYELGADFDGAWVRFASVTQGVVDAAKAAAAAAAASSSSSSSAPAEAPAEAPADAAAPADTGAASS